MNKKFKIGEESEKKLTVLYVTCWVNYVKDIFKAWFKICDRFLNRDRIRKETLGYSTAKALTLLDIIKVVDWLSFEWWMSRDDWEIWIF